MKVMKENFRDDFCRTVKNARSFSIDKENNTLSKNEFATPETLPERSSFCIKIKIICIQN